MYGSVLSTEFYTLNWTELNWTNCTVVDTGANPLGTGRASLQGWTGWVDNDLIAGLDPGKYFCGDSHTHNNQLNRETIHTTNQPYDKLILIKKKTCTRKPNVSQQGSALGLLQELFTWMCLMPMTYWPETGTRKLAPDYGTSFLVPVSGTSFWSVCHVPYD